jgi:hypothetical protein
MEEEEEHIGQTRENKKLTSEGRRNKLGYYKKFKAHKCISTLVKIR